MIFHYINEEIDMFLVAKGAITCCKIELKRSYLYICGQKICSFGDTALQYAG